MATYTQIKASKWNGQPWTRAECKYDGHRLTITCDDQGHYSAVGRKPVDLWPKLPRWEWSLPHDTIVDGELVAESGRATDVASVLAGNMHGTFVPFAVPRLDGRPVHDSWREHDSAMKILGMRGLHRPITHVHCASGSREWLLSEAQRLGVEGWVLKESPLGKWYKLKPTRTIDAVVMSCNVGTGTRFMMISSYDLGVYEEGHLKSIGTCKVLDEDDAVRWDVRENRERYEGRVLEVEYDEVAAKGRLKFARMLRWRDDKPAEECTIGQLKA